MATESVLYETFVGKGFWWATVVAVEEARWGPRRPRMAQRKPKRWRCRQREKCPTVETVIDGIGGGKDATDKHPRIDRKGVNPHTARNSCARNPRKPEEVKGTSTTNSTIATGHQPTLTDTGEQAKSG